MIFNGYHVFVKDSCPVYTHVPMFKKHRKKRNRVVVRIVSHYSEKISDGQVQFNELNSSMYCNRKTFNELKKQMRVQHD
jgi:mevalonate pyrophosphate decarboxylase